MNLNGGTTVAAQHGLTLSNAVRAGSVNEFLQFTTPTNGVVVFPLVADFRHVQQHQPLHGVGFGRGDAINKMLGRDHCEKAEQSDQKPTPPTWN